MSRKLNLMVQKKYIFFAVVLLLAATTITMTYTKKSATTLKLQTKTGLPVEITSTVTYEDDYITDIDITITSSQPQLQLKWNIPSNTELTRGNTIEEIQNDSSSNIIKRSYSFQKNSSQEKAAATLFVYYQRSPEPMGNAITIPLNPPSAAAQKKLNKIKNYMRNRGSKMIE